MERVVRTVDAIEHGNSMHDLGKQDGYLKALFDIELWGIQNDFYNEPLFSEIARLKQSYSPLEKRKEESNDFIPTP